MARHWEGDLSVGTYTSANVHHGNLVTSFPIVSWSGVGPDLSIMLYHNSAAVGLPSAEATRGMGFDLGPGWTTSYSGHLLLNDAGNPNAITVVDDDGTRDLFVEVGGVWHAPSGVIEVLTQTAGGWRLTFKDQSYREFGATGLLVRVVDAAGRPVQFFYNEDGRLHHLLDPSDGAGYLPNDVPDRTWVFRYGRSNRLEQVADAMGFATKFTYDAAGRITRLTDKDGDAYTYAYDAANRVVRV